MNNVTRIQQRIDTVDDTFHPFDQRNSGYDDSPHEVIDLVKARLQQKLTEMWQVQIEYERISQEYQKTKDVLRSLITNPGTCDGNRINPVIPDRELRAIGMGMDNCTVPGGTTRWAS